MAFAIGGRDNFGNIIDGPDSLAWANAHPYEQEPQGSSSSAALDALLEAQGVANDIAMQQLEISQRQADIAAERYDYWKKDIWPFQQDLIDQAKAGLDIGYAAERASSDMAINAKNQEAANARDMRRIGIDPNNPRYQGILKNYNLYKQASIAGAANNARIGTDQANRNMRLQVAGMGSGIPSQSMSAYSGAASGLTGAANSKLTGSQGLASAYNVGSSARVGTEQFNAEMTARANRLDFGQQQLAANQQMFENNMSTSRQIYNNQQEQQMWGAIGNLTGLAAGVGLGYATAPSTSSIGASAIGTSTGVSAGSSGGGSWFDPVMSVLGGSSFSSGYSAGRRGGTYGFF